MSCGGAARSCDEKWSCEKWNCDELWCDELWDEAARREQERRDPSEKQEPHTVMWRNKVRCIYIYMKKENTERESEHDIDTKR